MTPLYQVWDPAWGGPQAGGHDVDLSHRPPVQDTHGCHGGEPGGQIRSHQGRERQLLTQVRNIILTRIHLRLGLKEQHFKL